MTELSQALLAIACLVITASALLAIFHPRFDDTLLQRAGLCFAGSGASLTLVQMGLSQHPDRAVLLTLAGAALYAGSTVFKLCLRGRQAPDTRRPNPQKDTP